MFNLVKKLLKKGIIFTGTFLFFFFIFGNKVDVHATDLPIGVTETIKEQLIVDNGTVWFITDDAKRTSSIYYCTKGFTIFRCIEGKEELSPTGDYIQIAVEEPYDEIPYTIGNKLRTRAYFMFSQEELLEKILTQHPDWYEEIINSKETSYLMFDGIMVVIHESVDLDGSLKSNPSGNVFDFGNGAVYIQPTVYQSAAALAAAEAWGGGTDGMESHFNKYLIFYENHDVSDPVQNPGVNSGAVAVVPDYWTWNKSTSAEYDLQDGIPTSEQITNYIQTDEWFGAFSSIKQTVSKQYPIRVAFNYTYQDYSVKNNSSGMLEKTYFMQSETRNKTYYVTREASYYYIAELKLYDWQDSTVTNGSFPSGKTYYSSTTEPNITAISNDVNLTNSANAGYVVDATAPTESEDALHIQWASAPSSISVDLGYIGDNESVADNKLESALSTYTTTVENQVANAKVKNDTLKINNVTYLDGSLVSAPNVTKPSPFLAVFPDIAEFNKTITIPTTVANNYYKTKMSVNYKTLVPATNTIVSYSSSESDVKHIKDMSQEPILVHTPVISPVSIVKDGTEDCQLVSPNIHDNYQFLLDGTYTFNFNAAMHKEIQGYGWSGDPSKYDKYVKSKEVQFPFKVRIGSDYYESGEWITVGNTTTFYIPTWATEGSNYIINYRVTAENVGAGSADATQGSANTDFNNYVATYQYTCEVSGRIYDFSITGVNDADIFSGWSTDMSDTCHYSFMNELEQKRVGIKNRLGEPYIRLANGNVLSAWKTADITPLADGSSHAYTEMGALWKGSTFNFVIKTMANLTKSTDYVSIKPTFRYVFKDGTVKEDIATYYHDLSTDEELLYVKYGSVLEEPLLKEVIMGDTRYKGAYTIDEVDYTVAKDNQKYGLDVVQYEFLQRPVPSYTTSKIILNNQLRLYTGKEEELAMNLSKNASSVGDLVIDNATRDLFKQSMQTWFGQYTIPTSILVCDANIDVIDYATYHDLNDYSDIWLKDGYLVINFQITTVKDGVEHLSYVNLQNQKNYGNCNMWAREGCRSTAVVDGTTINLKYGDVVIVNTKYSLCDKYKAGYFIIN